MKLAALARTCGLSSFWYILVSFNFVSVMLKYLSLNILAEKKNRIN